MRVGIITLLTEDNFGSALQAYALLEYLKRLGYDAYLINRINKPYLFDRRTLLNLLKRSVSKYMLRKVPRVLPDCMSRSVTCNIHAFIEKYINPKTIPIVCEGDLNKLRRYGFDAYVVGSDQVWRSKFNFSSLSFFNYFLDFAESESSIKISYASSFGVDCWEYDEIQTQKMRYYLSQFKAISVRETSGVDLCREFLSVDAVPLIDPALLLDVSVYRDFIQRKKVKSSEGELYMMILDDSIDKQRCVSTLASQYGYHSFSRYREGKTGRYLEVEEWLKGFEDAQFVFTDSFHGCVFSILFNKPFCVYMNPERGKARMISLLEKFGLMDRLVTSYLDIKKSLFAEIDWEGINHILEIERKKSKEYILLNLRT